MSVIVYELVPDTDSEVGEPAPKHQSVLDRINTLDRINCDAGRPSHFKRQASTMELMRSRTTTWPEWLDSVFHSTGFQTGLGLIITANAFIIGLATDHPDWINWVILENMFLGFFAIELASKIALVGPRRFFYYYNKDFEFDMIDTIVVSIGLFDVFVGWLQDYETPGSGSKHGHDPSMTSLLRIFRLLRLVRLFRLFKALKKLYLLTVGLIESIRATFLVAILFGGILYACAVALTGTLGHVSVEAPGHEFLHAKFGTVRLSMMSLFNIASSPDLSQYHDSHVLTDYPYLLAFLVLWVIFGAFGMVAMLTGVISESLFEKNQARTDEMHAEHEEKRQAIRQWCKQTFSEIPEKNQMGEVPKECICSLLPEFEELCKELGCEIDTDDIENLPDYMDEKDSGLVGFHDFEHHVLSSVEQSGLASVHELKHILVATKMKCDKGFHLMEKVIERLDRLESPLFGGGLGLLQAPGGLQPYVASMISCKEQSVQCESPEATWKILTGTGCLDAVGLGSSSALMDGPSAEALAPRLHAAASRLEEAVAHMGHVLECNASGICLQSSRSAEKHAGKSVVAVELPQDAVEAVGCLSRPLPLQGNSDTEADESGSLLVRAKQAAYPCADIRNPQGVHTRHISFESC